MYIGCISAVKIPVLPLAVDWKSSYAKKLAKEKHSDLFKNTFSLLHNNYALGFGRFKEFYRTVGEMLQEDK